MSLLSLVTNLSGIWHLSSFVYIAEVVESVVWGVLDQDSGMDVVHVSTSTSVGDPDPESDPHAFGPL